MDDTTPDLTQGTPEPATDETTVVPGAAEPEAEPAQPDPDAPGEETPEPPPKPSGVDKRISRLVYEREEAKRQAAYWQGLAQGSKGGAPQGAPQATDGPPRQEQFETYDAYLGAFAEYKIETKLAQERQRLTAEMEARELRGSFESRAAEARQKHPDFDDVVMSEDLEISPHMRDAIMNSEDGAEVAYWLGKNPEQASRIARLNPYHQMLELGRVSARLAAPPPPPAPKPQASAAPAPITPVRAKAVAVEGLRDDVSVEEWMRRRAKELHKR
jgi:hypothetical protein